MKWEWNEGTKVTFIAILFDIVIGFISRTWWKCSDHLL